MNEANHFDRIEEAFEVALKHPREDWNKLLESHFPDEPDLRGEVAALLEQHQLAFDWFDEFGAGLQRAAPEELEAGQSMEGARIGPYRLLREIGRGGMGAVYLAERADGQFEQQVAVKLIRKGRESDETLRRFLAERQILSQLEHPGIARLLDGGATSDGLPYFVLEYVSGKPLLRHCQDLRLAIKDRLRLFLLVADAVEYAHRNLVVHRDLKPGNIMVTAEGVVKLLDFGIAKPLARNRPEDGETLPAHRALTPEYAAPEQWQGQPVTTATDVYGLGVVLYEMLSGQRPLELKTKTWEELERVLLHEEPEAVSSAVRRTRDGTYEERPDVLRKQLAGDLDTICAKALQKSPDRRYRSAGEFSDDIRRHLGGLPVIARPDSAGYRARKFIQRHKLGVSIAAAMLLVTAGFSTALAIQSARLARERDKAQRVSEMFVDLFSVSDPDLGLGGRITAREILDRGAEKIEGGLESQPEVKAGLMDVMVRVYHKLGLFPPARHMAEQSLALRRSSAAGAGVEVAENLHRLGLLLHDEGKYDESALRFEEALQIRRSALGPAHPDTAATATYLGLAYFRKGNYDAAQPLFERALSVLRRTPASPGANLADAVTGLGMLHYAKARFPQSASLLREAVELRRQQSGGEHPQLADTLNNLASVLSRMGKPAEAEPLHQEAIGILRKVRPGHPKLATALNNLGLVLLSRGDSKGAEGLLREAIAIRRDRLEPTHPDLGQSLNNLAILLQNSGRLEEAETEQRAALRIVRANFQGDHVAVMQSTGNLGYLLHAMNRTAEAEKLLREALAMSRRLLGGEHPLVATNLNNLASLLHDSGRDGEANYREALSIRRKALPAGHPHIAYVLVGLGQLLEERGDAHEAEPLLREALEIRRKTLPAGAAEIGEVESALGATLVAMKRRAEAVPLLRSGYEALRARHGAGHRLARKAARRLAAVGQVR